MATRTEIREAIALLIEPFFTQSYAYREDGVGVDDLPCAFVTIEAGDSEEDFDRAVITDGALTIELVYRGAGDRDAALDLLAKKINDEFNADETLGGLVEGIKRGGFSYDPDPESLITTLALSYAVTYEDED